MNNQFGFSSVAIFFVTLVVILIGGGAWYFIGERTPNDQVGFIGNVEAEGIFSSVTSPLVMNLILIKTGDFTGSSFVLISKNEKIQEKISTLENDTRIKITGTVFRNNRKINYPEGGKIVAREDFDFIDVKELIVVSNASINKRATPEIQSSQQENQQSKDETINWNTYKNSQYGFELKYPETATLTESGEIYISFPSSDAKLYMYIGKNTSVPLMGTFGGRFEYNSGQRPDFMLLSEIGGAFTKDYFAVNAGGGSWDRVINAYKEKNGNYFIFSMYNIKHNVVNGNIAGAFLSEMRDKGNNEVDIFNKILSTFKFL